MLPIPFIGAWLNKVIIQGLIVNVSGFVLSYLGENIFKYGLDIFDEIVHSSIEYCEKRFEKNSNPAIKRRIELAKRWFGDYQQWKKEKGKF